MDCLPGSLAGRRFYQPTDQGFEQRLRERMEEIKRVKEQPPKERQIMTRCCTQLPALHVAPPNPQKRQKLPASDLLRPDRPICRSSSLGRASSPHITIDGECTAFAWAPDGRMVYATRHVFPKGKFDIQRDDLWLLSPDGAKLKIFDGQKYGRGSGTFSYTVTSLRWSPDSKRLTAALRTSQLASDRSGAVQEGRVLLLLDDDGHPIKMRKLISEIDGGLDGTWLAESGAMAYATAVSRTSPAALPCTCCARTRREAEIVRRTRILGYRLGCEGAMPPSPSSAAAETARPGLPRSTCSRKVGAPWPRSTNYLRRSFAFPERRQSRVLRTIQTLEIREIAHPQQFAQVRVASGDIGWSSDGSHLLIKRGDPREAGDLI